MSYVHVRGRDVDGDGAGRPLLLRGVGLGNWLLPEGYMWGFGDGLASPRQIEARVERLIGAAAAADVWKRFRDVFVTEQDIARIAELGFDHVRLPINSRVLLTDDGALRADGFGLIDRVVQWCDRHGLWVTPGEPYDESMAFTVTAGQEFRFPLAGRPRRWLVRATNPAAFDVRWSHGALVVRATADAVLHRLDLVS
jgi:hypothetical protein